MISKAGFTRTFQFLSMFRDGLICTVSLSALTVFFGFILALILAIMRLSRVQPFRFLGIDRETSVRFWRKSLELYLGTTDEQTVRAVEEKAMVMGYMRLLRRRIRRNGYDTEEGRREIACYRARLCELLPRTDSLVF